MKFQIETTVFQEALGQVSHVVATKTTLPILSNVLIVADDSGLELSTTNLDVAISVRVPASVEENGKTTLPARKLGSIVRELAGSEVQISVDEGNTASVKSGPSFFKILGLSESEFPKIGEFDEAREFSIDQRLLKDALRRTAYAISTDETRYVLNGVNVVIGDGTLTLVATDGRRLAMVEQDLDIPGGSDDGKGVIIPTKAVMELQRLLQDEGEMKVQLTGSQAAFTLNNSFLVTKLIEGNYPNYKQVIPGEALHRIPIEREVLHNAVKRVALLVNEKTNSIKFTFDDSLLTISTNSPEVGEAKESLDIKYSGPNMSLAFNPEFVMAPLRNLDNDEVFLDLIDEASPGVVKIDDKSFLYVIMPMRVTG